MEELPRPPHRRVRSASLALALALAVGLGGCSDLVPQTRPRVVTTVGQIRSLPAPLTDTVDVKLTGTVTFFNSALDRPGSRTRPAASASIASGSIRWSTSVTSSS